MAESANLRKLLDSCRDVESRVGAILAWMVAELSVQGAAVLEAEPGFPGGVRMLSAAGSLVSGSQVLASRIAKGGLPQGKGMIALPAGAGDVDVLYCQPLSAGPGLARSVLVLHGRDVEETVRACSGDLDLPLALLLETLQGERASRQGEREKALSGLLTGGASESSDAAAVLALLTDGLRLPMYTCDARGLFAYASAGFLSLTGYPALEDLARSDGFFIDPMLRADELETARSLGKITSFPLAVVSGAGKRLEIHDSLVSLGDSFLGVFFDVTAFVSANAELKDALQVQELLNDSILAGTKALQRTQGASIRTLARLAEYRDPETGFHLQRICEFTRLLAMQVHERAPFTFRITREYADDLSLSSMLHDIGKVSIPDSILLKPGKLEPDEWDLMKKHTVFGWEVLHKADRELGEQSFLTLAATIALSHHERYDGGGYPHGSVGERIPLSARISAIADVYDALTSTRPYKEAWSHDRAVEEILGQTGTHFDPVLGEIFRDVNAQFAEVRRLFPG